MAEKVSGRGRISPLLPTLEKYNGNIELAGFWWRSASLLSRPCGDILADTTGRGDSQVLTQPLIQCTHTHVCVCVRVCRRGECVHEPLIPDATQQLNDPACLHHTTAIPSLSFITPSHHYTTTQLQPLRIIPSRIMHAAERSKTQVHSFIHSSDRNLPSLYSIA